jgi:hypothetical protein
MDVTYDRASGREEVRPGLGVDPATLSTVDLLRELRSLHDSRYQTFRHGSDDALAHHDRRTAELEREYRRRFPDREVDPRRLRDGSTSPI